MQRLLRRTALAKRQSENKAKKVLAQERRLEEKRAWRQRNALDRLRLDAKKDERLRRREDWMRGPLAPRRDAGLDAQHYGTIAPTALQAPPVPAHKRRKYINFAPGDRACIMKGPDKGKISTVTAIDAETETATLKFTNMVDVRLPEWMTAQFGHSRRYNSMPLPVPLDDLRLVVALEDPKTGTTRDVLVENLRAGGPFVEREYGSSTPRHTRYAAGDELVIPWPEEEMVEEEDKPWDTLRIEVETPTWTPSLLSPPFESSVMDELRNKYGKHRKRHDPEYIEQKKLQDYREEYLQSRTLWTPVTEARLKKIAEKQSSWKKLPDGNYKMGKQTEDFIDQFMKQNASRTT